MISSLKGLLYIFFCLENKRELTYQNFITKDLMSDKNLLNVSLFIQNNT